MDLSDQVLKPLKSFSKDSARLVKRCTKPDRKGGRVAGRGRGGRAWGARQRHSEQADQVLHWHAPLRAASTAHGTARSAATPRRVLQGLHQDRAGLHRHGLHRLLCQAAVHREWG